MLREFLADQDTPCPACGYNLRGLQAEACPECSAPVLLRVMTDEPLRRWRWPLLVACGAVLVVHVLDIAIVVRAVGHIDPATLADWEVVLRVLMAFILVVWAGAACFEMAQQWRTPRLSRGLRMALWVLIALPVMQLPRMVLWIVERLG
jgi:hypothetical protein